MPVFLVCFVEHHKMLHCARQLRAAVRDSYGNNPETPEFNAIPETSDNARVKEHLVCIADEMKRLFQKYDSFSPDQKKEFSLLKHVLSDIISCRNRGWVGFFHTDIDYFIEILETGAMSC